MGGNGFVKTKKPGRADCLSLFTHKKTTLARGFQMARPEGLEPSTYRLTAGRSTIELRANKSF